MESTSLYKMLRLTETLAQAQKCIDEAEAKRAEYEANMLKAKKRINLYKQQVKHLTKEKERLENKLSTEIRENTKLLAGWQIAHASLHPEKLSESDYAEKKQFLACAKCI